MAKMRKIVVDVVSDELVRVRVRRKMVVKVPHNADLEAVGRAVNDVADGTAAPESNTVVGVVSVNRHLHGQLTQLSLIDCLNSGGSDGSEVVSWALNWGN